MKNKTAILRIGLLIGLLVYSESAFAKGIPIGDIMLIGRVERSGQRLVNDTSLFAGDIIKTLEKSGGVVRIGRGRLEIDQLSEVELVSEKPLKIVVKSGGLHFNFPVGTDFEIVTPQLSVRPTKGVDSYSGIVSAQPKKQDRITSRLGRYSILEREVGGATNTIHAGQVLVASLVMPALPQGPATTIATITELAPANAQVNVARAAKRDNFSTRATPGLVLASGDRVRSLQGNARIEFRDTSVITLKPGTDVTIEEEVVQGGLLRSISQTAGSLWFSITKATGTGQTKLSTPTAVAAIRGTVGQQDIDQVLAGSTTYSLEVGEEVITENITGQNVTLRSGQTVTAIRGVGFTAISALIAAIGPSLGGGGPGGQAGAGGPGGTGAPGGGGGVGAGGGVAGTGTTTTTAAATSAVASEVSAIISVTVSAAAVSIPAAIIPATTHNETAATTTEPFSRPGVQ